MRSRETDVDNALEQWMQERHLVKFPIFECEFCGAYRQMEKLPCRECGEYSCSEITEGVIREQIAMDLDLALQAARDAAINAKLEEGC